MKVRMSRRSVCSFGLNDFDRWFCVRERAWKNISKLNNGCLKVHLVKNACWLWLICICVYIAYFFTIWSKYVVRFVIFLNIFCNNFLLPAKPRLQKNPSRVTLTYFDLCDIISQSPVTQDKPNNGQWYVPIFSVEHLHTIAGSFLT